MTDPERALDVDEAIQHLDRRRFLPEARRGEAREDYPLPIGCGQTCSQPSTVAAMLRHRHGQTGARVLDIGAGSGWTTALLARLVGPTGMVLGLELEPELATWGDANLAAWAMRWAHIEPATPGVLGRPIEGGWSRILVSASARELPQELCDQLADGGRMVIPVLSTLWTAERHGDELESTSLGSYAFVPLR
ncbi:MAG: protein-L-isoaspartate carboxylmethyltransferase [Cellulomonas sp.]|uniref:protein-L-isoaspartate O-methyltransferase family protein n=1 Tax=Cellulomonas sp. TaxID=40001 RepID=UPI0017FCFBE1|nr:protein-L-isoaspartate carboxylmethyltransferase [Cellulomonas sp.]NMM32362.1 protein-L-isoaspartate carboxylmethyltransferase [Cellulomonas sp.]